MMGLLKKKSSKSLETDLEPLLKTPPPSPASSSGSHARSTRRSTAGGTSRTLSSSSLGRSIKRSTDNVPTKTPSYTSSGRLIMPTSSPSKALHGTLAHAMTKLSNSSGQIRQTPSSQLSSRSRLSSMGRSCRDCQTSNGILTGAPDENGWVKFVVKGRFRLIKDHNRYSTG